MGSMENPKTWVPYMINTRDCSQGFCSLNCPQWCYMIFPPPPPDFEFENEHKASKFSPLIVAVIGILASAFLLVSYYAIISKYCKNREGEDTSRNHPNEVESRDSSPINELPQQGGGGANNNGLDEAMIKSITVFKFKKVKGFNESTESCSVCLCDFRENESLRLLPKCSHAFHRMCIDTWLKSHSNCPLCRANIVFTPHLSPSPAIHLQESSSQIPNEQVIVEHDIEMGIQEMNLNPHNEAEIRGSLYKSNEGEQQPTPIRRSLSMNDCVSHGHLSIADVLHINQDDEEESAAQRMDQCPNRDGSETSKRRRLVANDGEVNCDASVRRSVSSSGRNIGSIPL